MSACFLYYLASTIDYNATKHNSIEYISHDECGAAVLLLGPAAAEAAPAASEEKRGSQRGKGLYIIENDFPFSTGRYPPRVLNLDALPEQEDNKAVFNAWGKCVQVYIYIYIPPKVSGIFLQQLETKL